MCPLPNCKDQIKLCDLSLWVNFHTHTHPLSTPIWGLLGQTLRAIVPLDGPSGVCFVSVQRDKKFVDLVNFFPVW